jgi:anaerobic selenocysteine-containing dehydrogenase
MASGWKRKWRNNEKYDPYVKKGSGFDYYGNNGAKLVMGDLDKPGDPAKNTVDISGKAKIYFRPYASPVEQPDANYDLWLCTGRVLEHWHSGTMTRRVPELHRAVPNAVCWINQKDADAKGLKRNDLVWIESRRGKVKVRLGNRWSQPYAARHGVCALVRRRRADQQGHAGHDLSALERDGLQEVLGEDLQGLSLAAQPASPPGSGPL